MSTDTNTEAIAQLREMLPPGSTVYTILRHTSRSGMLRIIDPVAILPDGSHRHIGRMVADLIVRKYDTEREGVKCHGCGMDMGFDLVYSISQALYPEGFACIGKDEGYRHYCPSNDHSNGDRDWTPHHHKAGGYALNHRWL